MDKQAGRLFDRLRGRLGRAAPSAPFLRSQPTAPKPPPVPAPPKPPKPPATILPSYTKAKGTFRVPAPIYHPPQPTPEQQAVNPIFAQMDDVEGAPGGAYSPAYSPKHNPGVLEGSRDQHWEDNQKRQREQDLLDSIMGKKPRKEAAMSEENKPDNALWQKLGFGRWGRGNGPIRQLISNIRQRRAAPAQPMQRAAPVAAPAPKASPPKAAPPLVLPKAPESFVPPEAKPAPRTPTFGKMEPTPVKQPPVMQAPTEEEWLKMQALLKSQYAQRLPATQVPNAKAQMQVDADSDRQFKNVPTPAPAAKETAKAAPAASAPAPEPQAAPEASAVSPTDNSTAAALLRARVIRNGKGSLLPSLGPEPEAEAPVGRKGAPAPSFASRPIPLDPLPIPATASKKPSTFPTAEHWARLDAENNQPQRYGESAEAYERRRNEREMRAEQEAKDKAAREHAEMLRNAELSGAPTSGAGKTANVRSGLRQAAYLLQKMAADPAMPAEPDLAGGPAADSQGGTGAIESLAAPKGYTGMETATQGNAGFASPFPSLAAPKPAPVAPVTPQAALGVAGTPSPALGTAPAGSVPLPSQKPMPAKTPEGATRLKQAWVNYWCNPALGVPYGVMSCGDSDNQSSTGGF